MLGENELVAFVATTDLDRAGEFYGGVLGLPLIERNEFACVFDADGTSLRVTKAARVAPAPYTVLGWKVNDIEAAIRELEERGVEFARFEGMDQDEMGVWHAPFGTRVAWFRDPDGNTLSVSQS